jgi:hypothetical protein
MPCNSGYGDSVNTFSGSGEDFTARRQVTEIKQELDNVTNMLCSLLRVLDGKVTIPPDVAQWFDKHQEHDRSQGRF